VPSNQFEFDMPDVDSYFLSCSFIVKRGAQLKSHGGPKKIFVHRRGLKLICFSTFKGGFHQKPSQRNKLGALGAKLRASAGHIWPAGRMLCIPCLDGRVVSPNCTQGLSIFLIGGELRKDPVPQ